MVRFNIRFTLDGAVRRPFCAKLPGEITVLTKKGEEYVMVKGIEAEKPEDAVGRALEIANWVLDQHAFEHGEALKILEAPRLIEYEGPDGKTTVYAHVMEAVVHIEASATVWKSRADGTIEKVYSPDEPVNIMPSRLEGLRFYRRACIAHHLHNWFEAFREYFRAIEWATTEIRDEWKKGGQSLTEVLQDVFADEKSCEHLECIASKCPSFPQNYGDRLFEEVAKYLYERHRCELDHAKSFGTYKAPFDPVAENEVRGALGLVRYVAKELLAYLEKGG